MEAGHGAAACNLQAVVEADLMHLDIVAIQETKITSEKHANRVGKCDTTASETSTNNQGGVAFFIQRFLEDQEPGWSCEDAKIYGMKCHSSDFWLGEVAEEADLCLSQPKGDR
jgi:exonuclease III